MPNPCIIGAGGHARVIASLLAGVEPIFLTTNGEDEDAVIGRQLERTPHAEFYIGIGNNAARRRIAEKIRALQGRMPPCVAPNAFIARDADILDGAVVCPGAVIGSQARVGFATIVNTLSSVDHDCALGDYSQVTAGVTFGGTVKVGTTCFFGVKSAVIPGVSIGDDVSVMAGSVVVKNVPDGAMVGGIPARILARAPTLSAAPGRDPASGRPR